MTSVQREYANQISGALGQMPGAKSGRVEVTTSALPSLVPPGTECEVGRVHFSKLKFNDLVLASHDGGYHLRRVLRSDGEGVFLGGEGNSVEYLKGTPQLVKKVWLRGEAQEVRASWIEACRGWLASFFGTPHRLGSLARQ